MPLEPLRPMVGECQPEQPTDPGVRIGHVHLKVADLERALAFYCGVLGFELMQRYGTEAAFIAAGGYHYHIGLNTWESRGGSPPPPGSTSRQVDAIEVRQHARDHRLIRSEDDQHVCKRGDALRQAWTVKGDLTAKEKHVRAPHDLVVERLVLRLDGQQHREHQALVGHLRFWCSSRGGRGSSSSGGNRGGSPPCSGGDCRRRKR
jgi:catechol-2,3-dioxygenase